MEDDARRTPSGGTVLDRTKTTSDNIVAFDLESYVHVELDVENNNGSSGGGHCILDRTQGLYIIHDVIEIRQTRSSYLCMQSALAYANVMLTLA